jgi:hypothetical protein
MIWSRFEGLRRAWPVPAESGSAAQGRAAPPPTGISGFQAIVFACALIPEKYLLEGHLSLLSKPEFFLPYLVK